MVARKMLFAWFAFSASSLAFSASCLAFFSSSMDSASLSVRSFTWFSSNACCLFIDVKRNQINRKVPPTMILNSRPLNHQVIQKGGRMTSFNPVVLSDHFPWLFKHLIRRVYFPG